MTGPPIGPGKSVSLTGKPSNTTISRMMGRWAPALVLAQFEKPQDNGLHCWIRMIVGCPKKSRNSYRHWQNFQERPQLLPGSRRLTPEDRYSTNRSRPDLLGTFFTC